MPVAISRQQMIARLREAAVRDVRIVGLVDYGSGAEGRADEWSDVDVSLFIRDADFDEFKRDWQRWAAQFGDLLLAYVGKYEHPWTVYDAEPVPLRVDFYIERESRLDVVLTEFTSPTSVAAMVLYDGTGGRLSALVQTLVGRNDRPDDFAATFERECGDFWYFLLYVYCKLRRGEQWVARGVYHMEAQTHLLLLMRLEAGAIDRWRGANAAVNVERTLSPARLQRLDACVPAVGVAGLLAALDECARLGAEVCESIAAAYAVPWPKALAERVQAVIASAIMGAWQSSPPPSRPTSS
ncbi:MAG: aminoglycoside 6-adenylyltransferase [Dehalococcoidia bacterium]